MRRFLWILCAGALCLGTVGCGGLFAMRPAAAPSPRSTIFGGAYWLRVGDSIVDDFHQLRVDFDRIFLDLDDRPLEDL